MLPSILFGQEIKHVNSLDIPSLPAGKTMLWVDIAQDGLGKEVSIPVIIMKGEEGGPLVGINASIHGNELNGIPIIQHVIDSLNHTKFKGTVIAIPGMNVPGILHQQREFGDGQDLNRIMPGKSNGNESDFYANSYLEKVAYHFQYLIDLHTASFGRINTHYVRADLSDGQLKSWAMAQNANLVLNSLEASTTGGSGTLRAALAAKGIPGITIELGNPQVWQPELIDNGTQGILNILKLMGMVSGKTKVFAQPVICSKSYWLYTDAGGLLEVIPRVMQKIRKGDKIAILRDPFGNILEEYFSPEEGFVIGKSSNPVTPSGGRILHLGIEAGK